MLVGSNGRCVAGQYDVRSPIEHPTATNGIAVQQRPIAINVAGMDAVVGNLLLARAVGRRQELAMRTALGAGRSRLARQLMTESAAIAGFGAILGLGLGAALVRWMASLQPPNLPALVFRLDWRVLAFTLTVTAGSALLLG
ncbi:MAG: FtsX-like permease family protein, partial [Nitrospirae bacterium]|nr:FtsX-like permease family protein [Nitrospirota bacterium]